MRSPSCSSIKTSTSSKLRIFPARRREASVKGTRGRTVTLKMKFNDFEIITRSRSVPLAVASRRDLERVSIALLQNEMPVSKPIRLLGISLSALQADAEEETQLDLLGDIRST
jgi:DNA polymerase-4